jgi:hypothetical protein
MYTSSFLKERALAWFKPYLIDFVNVEEYKECKLET